MKHLSLTLFIIFIVILITAAIFIDKDLNKENFLEVYTCEDIYYISTKSPYRITTETGRYDKIFNTQEEQKIWLSEISANDSNQCKI